MYFKVVEKKRSREKGLIEEEKMENTFDFFYLIVSFLLVYMWYKRI